MRRTVLRIPRSADSGGSKGGLHRPSRTTARSQEGNIRGDALSRFTPLVNVGTSGCFVIGLPSYPTWQARNRRQPDLNGRMREVQLKSALQEIEDFRDRGLEGIRIRELRREPIMEHIPLEVVQTSGGLCSGGLDYSTDDHRDQSASTWRSLSGGSRQWWSQRELSLPSKTPILGLLGAPSAPVVE